MTMLTQEEMSQIRQIVGDEVLPVKEDVRNLELKMEHGFTALNQKIDDLKEIVSGIVGGIEDHERRLKRLETHAGIVPAE